jgi:hypothetical protein
LYDGLRWRGMEPRAGDSKVAIAIAEHARSNDEGGRLNAASARLTR